MSLSLKDRLSFLSLRTTQSVLSVDIGTRYLTLAELTFTKDKPQLTHFEHKELPFECVEESQLTNFDTLSELLKDMFEKGGFTQKKAIVSISGVNVITKRITVPKVDSHMMETQIRYEAENYIPFEINAVFFDYFKLKDSLQSDSIDVIMVAVLDTKLLEFLEIIEKAGLRCLVMDTPCFSLANCYLHNYKDMESETSLLLNVGHSYTSFLICSKGELVFSRDLPLGGHVYTSELQKQYGTSFQEAEERKLKTLTDDTALEEQKRLFQIPNNFIVSEIEETLSHFTDSYGSLYDPIKHCLLTGGASQVPGLRETLSHTLSLECDFLDGLRNLKAEGKLLTNQYIREIKFIAPIVLGLGLRGY